MGLIIVAHGDRRHRRLPDRRPGDRAPRLRADRLGRRHRRLARDHAARARARTRCSSRLGLFVLGGASATQDVAMNSHGVKVEKDARQADHVLAARRLGVRRHGRRRRSPRCSARSTSTRASPSAIASALLLVAARTPRASRIGHGSAAEGDDTPGFTLPSRGVVLLADPVPARHGHGGRDGRLGRAVPAPGPRRERRARRPRLLVLHRRHDASGASSATGSTTASAPSRCCAGARCSPACRSPRCC